MGTNDTYENLIKQMLETLTKDYGDGSFKPILEADVVGYLFYLWVSKTFNASRVHLDTRICGITDKRFDFVVGDVYYPTADKPCTTNPELIIEVKSFPIGFTDQQHRVHYYHVLEDDIPKVAKARVPLKGRYVLLFDEADYLKGFDKVKNTTRLSRIIETRNELDSNVKIIHLKRTAKLLKWKLL
jgi:hypothetical protein